MNYDAHELTGGLDLLAQALLGTEKTETFLVANQGNESFSNDVFTMNGYCWCDGDVEGHEEECPPNFIHPKSGIEVRWYKHSGRSLKANVNPRDAEAFMMWLDVVRECLDSIMTPTTSNQKVLPLLT